MFCIPMSVRTHGRTAGGEALEGRQAKSLPPHCCPAVGVLL